MKKACVACLVIAATQIAIATVVAHDQLNKSTESTNWVRHTFYTKESLGLVLSDLQDIETGQRGYLLTGNNAYLEPYRAALPKVWNDILVTKGIMKGDLIQTKRLEDLKPLVTAKLAEINSTIKVRDTEGEVAALKIVKTNQGKEAMDKIRRQIHFIEDQEEVLLRERLQRERQRREEVRTAVVGDTICSLILVLLGLFFLWLDYYWVRVSSALKRWRTHFRN